MIRKLYAWAIRMADHPKAGWILFAVSFAESSFFPIPPDTMLAPMVLANRKKAWLFATISTVGSVMGGLLGYALGAWLYDTVGHFIISIYHMQDQADHFRVLYNEYGAAIILIKGLTPIPYKLVTIASGLAAYPLIPFILLSFITRGVRFFAITALLHHYGEPIRGFLETHLEKAMLALLAIVVLGFVLFGFMF
jgi:membrane protein YqaA with SNARE-associated domain